MQALVLSSPRKQPNYPGFSEPELVSGIRSGDPAAINLLYDAYSAALYGVVYRIVRTEDDAQDILQDTFVKIWKNIDHYDAAKGRLFTWMMNVARNLSIDFVRSKYSKNNSRNENIDNNTEVAEQHFNFSINPELIDVRRFVSRLGNNQKALINLIYFQGYTQAEAAEELCIPLGTVKTRVRLSIIALRKYYM